jgi:pectate lyase
MKIKTGVMKRLAAVLCLSLMAGFFEVQSQTPYYMAGPVGYAAGVTGGGTPTASNTVTVSTAADFASALSGSKPVILVSGTITTSRVSCSASNISIIGLPGAKLVNLTQTADGSGILHLKSGSNVIIRNITFIGPGAYDEDGWDCLTNKGCTKLWVDHCEFQDGMDGNFDNTNTADNITVSWCKFTYLKPPKAGGSGGSNDHRFTNLVGGSDTDVPADGKYSITWLNCWWADGCVDRMARARNAQLDMLNCYWNSKVASKNIHLSPGTNGTYVYVENGVFQCSGDIVNFEKTGNNNVKFVNCSGGVANTGSVSAPSYSWTSTPVGTVVSMVTNATCGAGATLKVTAAGALSSGCSVTEVLESSGAKNENLLPGFKNFSNCFSSTGSDEIALTIYSMNGQAVSTTRGQAKASIDRLTPGIYFVKMHKNDRTIAGRFLKQR